jgi:TonB family protein
VGVRITSDSCLQTSDFLKGDVIKWFFLNIAFFFLTFTLLQSIQTYPQSEERDKEVVLNFKEQSLHSVLEEIRNQTGINFIYNDNLVDNIKFTGKIEGVPVRNAVNKILSKHNISFKVFNKNSCVLYRKEIPEESKYRALVIKEEIPNTDTTHILIEPKVISRIKPVYPPQAIENEIEGNVTLNLLVTKEGNVSTAVVKLSSGSAILDSAAIDYSYKMKFSPALDNGKPRSIWISMIYKYFFSD